MHGAAQKRNWSIWGKFKEPFPKMCQLAPRPMYINPGKYCSLGSAARLRPRTVVCADPQLWQSTEI